LDSTSKKASNSTEIRFKPPTFSKKFVGFLCGSCHKKRVPGGGLQTAFLYSFHPALVEARASDRDDDADAAAAAAYAAAAGGGGWWWRCGMVDAVL
jgi:hypothetical protein